MCNVQIFRSADWEYDNLNNFLTGFLLSRIDIKEFCFLFSLKKGGEGGCKGGKGGLTPLMWGHLQLKGAADGCFHFHCCPPSEKCL